jgi:hypothetical protein
VQFVSHPVFVLPLSGWRLGFLVVQNCSSVVVGELSGLILFSSGFNLAAVKSREGAKCRPSEMSAGEKRKSG